jgi:predicted kinase
LPANGGSASSRLITCPKARIARQSPPRYEELARSARQVARSGYVATLDAVFPTDALRQVIREAASLEGVPFEGLWLDAPVEIMEARLAARGADASDADAEVLRKQLSHTTVPDGWNHIDASGGIDRVVEVALGRAADGLTP